MYDPETDLWTALPNFTRPRLLGETYSSQDTVHCFEMCNLPRDQCFLTVLDGKLTAMDLNDFEVLGEDNIWRKYEYDGERRGEVWGISYALLPTSHLTGTD